MDCAEKMIKCKEYVKGLEEERRKIEVFQRELPLCLELVNQAIETCKQQLTERKTAEYMNGQSSDCSEQTSSDGPVLAEFIPIKKSYCEEEEEDDDEQESEKQNNNKDNKKSDWLRSVQLWNQTPDPLIIEESLPRKSSVADGKRNGGAFQPFQKEKSVGKTNNAPSSAGKPISSTPTAATSSTADTTTGRSGGSSKKEDKDELARKQRRCWSPELHRRFLHALQQLGGSHVATPKQIRELMKVDGLTNDEVKSHLQKYRLHTRRPSPTIHNNGNSQTPQFVVVGGIWVPPAEYAAVAAAPTSGAAAAAAAAPPPPAAPLPQRPKQYENFHTEERGCLSEGALHSNSPATSSSTHTTTASPVF